jgi:putative peptidoglycan lipid II flippase
MAQEHAARALSSSILRFFSGTLLSRITGMVRDISMAFCFGATPEVAAFMVAFRFSNLLRRLLGEGAIHSVFIPSFEKLKKEDPLQASRFFLNLLFFICFILIAIIVSVEALLAFGAPFFDQDQLQVVTYTRWMFPGILFICLFGITSALIQCENAFFTSSVAPVVFNLVWIASLFFLRHLPSYEAMLSLCKIVVLAYALQFVATVPGMLKSIHVRPFEKISIFSSDIKDLVKKMGFGVIGVGAVQINAFFDAFFSRAADLKGPAWLWYALRLEQLPMALFAIAIGSALLPPLSRAIKGGDDSLAKTLFDYASKKVFALMVPCTFAIFVLGFSAVGLIYGHGEFGPQDQIQTTQALWAYGLSLVPSALCIIASTIYWAKDDYQTPMRASLLTVGVNLALNTLFVFGFGFGALSVALATSISAYFNAYYLLRPLHPFGGWHWDREATQVVVASCIATVAAFFAGGGVFFGGCVFLLTLALLAYVLRMRSFFEFFSFK